MVRNESFIVSSNNFIKLYLDYLKALFTNMLLHLASLSKYTVPYFCNIAIHRLTKIARSVTVYAPFLTSITRFCKKLESLIKLSSTVFVKFIANSGYLNTSFSRLFHQALEKSTKTCYEPCLIILTKLISHNSGFWVIKTYFKSIFKSYLPIISNDISGKFIEHFTLANMTFETSGS